MSNGARNEMLSLVGAGVDVLADAVEDLVVATDQHSGSDEIG